MPAASEQMTVVLRDFGKDDAVFNYDITFNTLCYMCDGDAELAARVWDWMKTEIEEFGGVPFDDQPHTKQHAADHLVAICRDLKDQFEDDAEWDAIWAEHDAHQNTQEGDPLPPN